MLLFEKIFFLKNYSNLFLIKIYFKKLYVCYHETFSHLLHSIDERFFFLLKKKSQALMLLLGFFLPSSHNFNQFLKKTKLVNKIFLALLLFLFSVFYCYLKKRKIKYEKLFFYSFFISSKVKPDTSILKCFFFSPTAYYLTKKIINNDLY
jgi:hypothetical protein